MPGHDNRCTCGAVKLPSCGYCRATTPGQEALISKGASGQKLTFVDVVFATVIDIINDIVASRRAR
jgi:hypothetical protein